jgi:hypothetical protein
MLMKFSSFVDKKTNKARKELQLVRDVLEESDIKVKDFTKERDPYLFVPSTKKGLDFGGIRVYKVGSSIAYRIQNEGDTEPYGMSYPLDIEGMFDDLIGDMDEAEAANEIKKAVVEEINGFFERSMEAQEEIGDNLFDPQSKILIPGRAGDLSNMM